MSDPIRILLIEDVPEDAELLTRELRRADLTVITERVDSEATMAESLVRFAPDLILSDYNLPDFGGTRALEIAQMLRPDVPFIFVSGAIGEERAIEALHHGAVDYVLKGNRARLIPAVRRALDEAEQHRAHQQAERELEESELRFSSIASASNDWIWERDRYGVYTFSNHAVEPKLGYSSEELLGTNVDAYLHEDDRTAARDLFATAIAKSRGWQNAILRWRHRDGSARYMECTALPLLDSNSQVVGYRGVNRDITLRVEQQQKISRLSRVHAISSGISAMIFRIRDRQEIFQSACHIAVATGNFRMASIGTIDSEIPYWRWFASVGFDAGHSTQVLPTAQLRLPRNDHPACRATREQRPVVCNDIATDPAMAAWRDSALQHGFRSVAALPLMVEGKVHAVFVLHADVPNFFDQQELELLSNVGSDLSFALEYLDKAEQLHYVSWFDPLTRLANRALFFDRLAQMAGNASEDQARLGVVVIDIQRFRDINDTFGRGYGDALLQAFATRLEEIFGSTSTLARISSNRFAVAVRNLSSLAMVQLVERCVAEVMAAPFILAGTEVRVAFRIGVSLFPEDGQNAEALFRNAEAALRRAKDTSRSYAFYSPEMNARVAEHLQFDGRLRSALQNKEFQLHYQTKVNIRTRRICGLEALMRWRDARGANVSPTEFIPVLEETGMIIEAGRWVIEQAVADIRRWQALGWWVPRVAVNVSHIQIQQQGFVETVLTALGRRADAGGLVDLEITESVLLGDTDASVEKLRDLRAKGIAIYLDDFGTGYSNLTQIAALPLDGLKIDRAFIEHMEDNRASSAIVATMINLGRALGIQSIAEGVETERQAQLLTSLGCDQGQGYLFGRPFAPEDMTNLLDVSVVV